VELPGAEVHVWHARLDHPEAVRNALYATLEAEERAQTERLRAERDRERFVCAQGFLRDVLARYLGLAPREIAYRRNAHGKPDLDFGEEPWLRFNLTHSHDLALVAVVRNREIGVDLERIDTKRPLRKLIERFFAPAEVEALCDAPDDALPGLFYTSWTRKEAYVKARGIGLRFGMRRFAMTVGGSAPALLSVEDEPEEPGRWTVQDLPVPLEFRSALVVEGHSLHPTHHNWEPA
jgi:4'-phosphopantetheinyl transferase